jgi:hypothetical protein
MKFDFWSASDQLGGFQDLRHVPFGLLHAEQHEGLYCLGFYHAELRVKPASFLCKGATL